jgi:hypothetical protein
MRGSAISDTAVPLSQAAQVRTPDEWAAFWFVQVAQFHQVGSPADYQFDKRQVITFMRAKLKANMPAWKRLKIVEGWIRYRNRVGLSKDPRLERIRAKLQELVIAEKHACDPESMEDVVGKIDPREPDVIQLLRRMLRLRRKAYNTEKAYVKWVRRFMQDRCLRLRELARRMSNPC